MKKIINYLGLMLYSTFILTGCENNANNEPKKESSTPDRIEKSEMIHRCGRKWSGEKDQTYGAYGDYCCEACYIEFYSSEN